MTRSASMVGVPYDEAMHVSARIAEVAELSALKPRSSWSSQQTGIAGDGERDVAGAMSFTNVLVRTRRTRSRCSRAWATADRHRRVDCSSHDDELEVL